MTYVYTPYIIPHTASAAVTIFIIVLMWKRRHLPGARSFIVMMAACHMWLVTNALEIMGQELAIKTFWVNLEYPALVTVTVAWLLAVLQYAGYKRFLNRRSIVVLSIVPMLTVLFLWTNSAHELMRTNIRLDRSGPFVTIAKDYGPWFWVHIAYTYGLMGSATLITLYSLFRYTHLYRGHALAWFAAVIIPSVWNVLYIFRINPLDPLDMTPISFTATGLLMLWGYTRFNLFDIIPTAREQVLQSMEDAVIVLDPFNRIADLNPAALRLLNDPHQQLVGQQSETVFARWPHLVEAYLDTTEARGEITISGPRTTRHYDLQISPLYDQHQRVSGRLIVLRDISSAANARHELQIAKNAIEDQHQRLRQELSLAHDIQLALLPTEPPWQDQRIQSACTIYPAREVGGDFYTFLNGQSAAGVVIGDVSGKGVGAALLMALLLNAVEDCAVRLRSQLRYWPCSSNGLVNACRPATCWRVCKLFSLTLPNAE